MKPESSVDSAKTNRNRPAHESGRDHRRAYRFVAVAGGTFFVLTVIAMVAYPGGSRVDSLSEGYSFFRNTFSDLGHYHGYRPGPKWLSFVLFNGSTAAAGIATAVFFITEARSRLRPGAGLATRLTAAAAGVLGTVTAMGFIGIGLTPADLFRVLHFQFVYVAFTLFPFATTLLLCTETEPLRRNVYAAFLLVLVAYMGLIYFGPEISTPAGTVIQATGQKVVVYAAIAAVSLISLWNSGVLPRKGKRSAIASWFTRRSARGYTLPHGSTDE
ncbi:MAG: hypothetical protein ACLFM0_00090 [Spirochaetales bacterium]